MERLEDRTVPSHLIVFAGVGQGSGSNTTYGTSVTISVGPNESKTVGVLGLTLDLEDVSLGGDSFHPGSKAGEVAGHVTGGGDYSAQDEVQATFQIVPDNNEQIGDPVMLQFAPSDVSFGSNGVTASFSYSIGGGLVLGQDLSARAAIGDTFSVDVQATVDTNGNTVFGGGLGGGVVDISFLHVGNLTPTVVVNPVSTTYDRSPHGTTGEAYGVGGVDLGPVVITYDTPDGNAPVDTGTYTATGTFAGNQDYTSATGTATISIGQATPSVTVNPIAVTFDTNAHGTTGEAYGVGGEDLGPVAITYNTPDGSTPVDAGTYTATGTFAGNQDYTGATGTANIDINKAIPTASIDPVAETPYDGSPHGTTGQVIGVGGSVLSNTVVYSDSSGNQLPDAPIHAGHYTATVSFDGNDDYMSASASTEIIIDKADATITITPLEVVYDGQAHRILGTATGVLGEDLSNLLDLGPFEVHAGLYWEFWTFNLDGSNPDYNSATGLDPLLIDKANATITVSPYSITYDGKSHTATGTATGVLGETLGGLDLAGTTHSTAGIYSDTWTFADTTGDYNNANGTISDKIAKGPLTVSVKSYLMLAGNKPPAISGTITGLVIGDTVNVAYSTTATARSKAGQYVTRALVTGASLSNYTLTVTNGTMFVVNQGADPAASGPKVLSFWDSIKNASLITTADLTALDGLNLVDNNGNAFDPTSVSQLQKWLSGASSKSNWGYRLSTQFAVAELNVLAGFANGSDLVYAGGLLPFGSQKNVPGLTSGGFLSVQNLFTSANALLLQDPLGGPTDTNDGYFEALTTALQAMNGNKSFVTQELSWNLVNLYQLGILW